MNKNAVVLFLVILFLTACTSNAAQNNEVTIDNDVMIKDVKLSQLENGMMNLIGDNTALFELNIENDAAKDIELTVDHYKNGVLQSTEMHFTSSLHDVDIDKPIYTIIANRQIDSQQQWIGTVITKDSSSSIQTDLANTVSYTSGTFQTIHTPNSASLGERKIIGTAIFHSEDIDGSLNKIETEEDLTYTSKFDHVYVYYMQVKK